MRRLRSILLLLLPALLTFSGIRARAQIYLPPPVFYPPFGYPRPHQPPPDPRDAPIEVGGYAMLGGAIEETPTSHSGSTVGAAGIYAQWNRFGLCPGLDLRVQGSQSELHGYLVGPRVAYQPRNSLRPFRLYAEALFGKNEITQNTASASGLITSSSDLSGVNRAAVIGLDLHADSAVAWRVIEFSKGDFTGLAGSRPQTIMTGILIHLP
jgi:hypothetical protein